MKRFIPALFISGALLAQTGHTQSVCNGADCPSYAERILDAHEQIGNLQIQIEHLRHDARNAYPGDEDADETRRQCMHRCAGAFKTDITYCRSANTLMKAQEDEATFSDICGKNAQNELAECLAPANSEDCLPE